MKKEKLFKLIHEVPDAGGSFFVNTIGINTYEECRGHIVNKIHAMGYDWDETFMHVLKLEKDNWQFSKFKIVPCKSKWKVDFLY